MKANSPSAAARVEPAKLVSGGSPGDPAPSGKGLVSLDSAIFKDVKVTLQARLGQVSLSVEDLFALKAGSVVKLDLKINDLVELRLNDSLVARGEIVGVEENFGVRIVEVAPIS